MKLWVLSMNELSKLRDVACCLFKCFVKFTKMVNTLTTQIQNVVGLCGDLQLFLDNLAFRLQPGSTTGYLGAAASILFAPIPLRGTVRNNVITSKKSMSYECDPALAVEIAHKTARP